MPWNQLIQIALLGAERAQPSPELSKALAARGIDLSAPLARVILEGAVVWRQISRVGYQPPQNVYVLPEPFDATAERPCPPQAARTLGRILEGSYAPALEEWLLLLGRANYHIPPECLPPLFDRCLQQPALWPQVSDLMGPRGRWLAPQNTAWQPFFGIPDIDAWHSSNLLDQRRAALVYLRQNNPERARQLLEASWSEEIAADRVVFLKTLEMGISPDDEPFLESCLDDGRKEVRQVASTLLAALPDSALSQQLWKYGKDWLELSPAGKIKIKTPSRLPDSLIRAGIGPESGKGADWLRQLVSRLTPQHWEAHFGIPPETFYSRLSPELAEAIEEAVAGHRNTKWATAIMAHWLKDNNPQFKMTTTKSRLLSLVPHADFSRLAFEAVKEAGAPLPERSPIFLLLTHPGHFWDDKLTAAVITGFQQLIASSKSYGWRLWHYKQLLSSAAYACRPSLYDALQKGWPFNSPVWHNWQAEVEQLLRIVDFRRRMRGEMEQNP